MFTGLIEAVAELAGREIRQQAGRLTLRLTQALPDPVPGESIAVSGVCLTLEKAVGKTWHFHVLAETFARTNLGQLPIGAKLNLERALRVGDRLGGHWVTGHVDAAAPVLGWTPIGEDLALTVALPPELRPQLVLKGSLAVDGVSLTIVTLAEDRFSVHLIPETRRRTALGQRATGALVNLETDLLGKYVLQALAGQAAPRPGADQPGLDLAALRRAGW